MSVKSFFSIFRKPAPSSPAGPPERLRFEQLADDMAQRLELWEKVPRLPGRGQSVGVLVTCWQQTAVPFFSLEVASALKQQGFEVTLVFDLVDLGLRSDSHFPVELKSIAELIPKYEKHFAVIRMDQRPDAAEEPVSDEVFIKRLIFENFCAILRGETAAQHFISGESSLLPVWKRHAALLRQVLSREAGGWAWMLIPGGIYSVSGIYLQILRQLGLPFYTYDSGAGLLAVARGGVTSYLGEVPDAVKVLESELTDDEWKIIEDDTKAQMDLRWQGKDDYVRQPSPDGADPADASDLLLLLNCRADNAAMERQLAFRNVEDWLRSVVSWALKKKLRLIVRQHPSEAREIFRGSDDYAAIIRSIDPEGQSTTFVAGVDPVNTYMLLQRTKVALPYTSRSGVEAALVGIPVILGSRCYYDSLSFVQQAGDPETYFALIEQALQTPPVLTPAAQREARLVYYLVEKCFFLVTRLTPVIEDCQVWIKQPPEELWATPPLQDLRTVFFTQRSLFEVLFRRRFRK